MPLQRIMSTEDNLPPESGPYDEDEPLLFPAEQKTSKKHIATTGIVLCFAALLIASVTFAAMYFHLVLKGHNPPNWPKASMSPLGKYSKAAVAADNEYCSEIGRNILLKGGNAVDAAVAALFCIGIMDSHSAGLGGGHFMTIYNATTGECLNIDARETAPSLAYEDMYKDRWADSKTGWRSLAVPGEVHGMFTAFSRFGSGNVTWKSLVQPTIELMEEGYPTSAHMEKGMKRREAEIMKEPTMKGFINPATGKIYARGEQIRTRPEYLETLRRLANSTDPIKTFYDEMGDVMTREINERGGNFTKEDFLNYKTIVHGNNEVSKVTLRNGRTVCGAPPPAGSALSMAILSVLDGYDYRVRSFTDMSTMYHHFVEASKFAYAQRSWMGDPAFVGNSSDISKMITSVEWAENVRSRMKENTQPDAYYGGSFEGPPIDHGTSHISIIDKQGNAVSVTSTINLYMGAAVTSPSTGILWNDEMDDFSAPGHPNFFGFPPSPANFIRPGKRAMSSMSPLIVLEKGKDGKQHAVLAVGGAGGSTIISGVASVAMHVLYLKANVKQAIDAPRMHNQLQPNVTRVESTFPKQYLTSMESRGHIFKTQENITVVTAVQRGKDGQIYANSDFRKGEESSSAGF